MLEYGNIGILEDLINLYIVVVELYICGLAIAPRYTCTEIHTRDYNSVYVKEKHYVTCSKFLLECHCLLIAGCTWCVMIRGQSSSNS